MSRASAKENWGRQLGSFLLISGAGIAFLFLALHQLYQQYHHFSVWPKTKAVILRYEMHIHYEMKGKPTYPRRVYQFQALDNHWEIPGPDLSSQSNDLALQPGQAIEIAYDPNNLHEVIADADVGHFPGLWYQLLLGTFFILLGVPEGPKAVRTYREMRKNRDYSYYQS